MSSKNYTRKSKKRAKEIQFLKKRIKTTGMFNTPDEPERSCQEMNDHFFRCIDRLAHAILGRITFGISPASLALAYFDWFIHLAVSPGKNSSLLEMMVKNNIHLSLSTIQSYFEQEKDDQPCDIPQDVRFKSEEWQQFPFRFTYQNFLLTQEWWKNATSNIEGVSHHHLQVVSFVARQLLDMVSPSNFIPFNPTLLNITYEQGGTNLTQGMMNWMQDCIKSITPQLSRKKEYLPGKNVAITPGHVIYRNRLIELIQYNSTTQKVEAEPILIVPAWIMKYYILDLSPYNSLVKYLVDQGHTVFIISWRNPTSEDRDLGMDDYLNLGIMCALDIIQTILPSRKINAVGYCLGGTLLSIAAAYLSRNDQNILNTITLLAAQTDFTQAGELTLFIDESQVHFLEDLMWMQGYMDAKQMSGAFQLLRSNDLIWSRLLHDYLIGKRIVPTALMAWSEDATRMPYRMHSEYLRRFFLENELFEGRYKVDGVSLALSDIRIPIFALATEKDHIAPWRSVYKINLLADTEVTFALTSGGHNAGILSEPGHKRRRYRISKHTTNDVYIDPESWFQQVKPIEGSWWPEWLNWLNSHNTRKIKPPKIGALYESYKSLGQAPGSYVLD